MSRRRVRRRVKVPHVTEKPRGKRIVLCFDGTANQIGAGNLTNVAKIFEM
jgi:uncharacterized protein (DUF2235 family)